MSFYEPKFKFPINKIKKKSGSNLLIDGEYEIIGSIASSPENSDIDIRQIIKGKELEILCILKSRNILYLPEEDKLMEIPLNYGKLYKHNGIKILITDSYAIKKHIDLTAIVVIDLPEFHVFIEGQKIHSEPLLLEKTIEIVDDKDNYVAPYSYPSTAQKYNPLTGKWQDIDERDDDGPNYNKSLEELEQNSTPDPDKDFKRNAMIKFLDKVEVSTIDGYRVAFTKDVVRKVLERDGSKVSFAGGHTIFIEQFSSASYKVVA